MMETTTDARTLTILLVDEQILVRSGIARLIADIADMKIIGQVSSGEEAIDFVKNLNNETPDVVIMDARLPGIGGI